MWIFLILVLPFGNNNPDFHFDDLLDPQNEVCQLSFNAALKVDSSDADLVLVRELEERLGLGELIAEHLSDSRRGRNTLPPEKIGP